MSFSAPTAHTISQNHVLAFVEDFPVRDMSSSAAGTSVKPGTHVRAKSGLNKAILDQGWFEFRRQLDYKLAWNGGHLCVHRVGVPALFRRMPAALAPAYGAAGYACCAALDWRTR